MSQSSRRIAAWWAGTVVTAVAVVAVVTTVDGDTLRRAVGAAVTDPVGLVVALGGYLAAFVARALAWRRTLPGVSAGHALAAIHVATAANHVLPLRLGEPLRITSVVRRTDTDVASATASTVALRTADVVAVIGIGLVVGPGVAASLLGSWWPLLLAAAVAGSVAATFWLARLSRDHGGIRLPGVVALSLTVVSWLLEGVVVWQVAAWAGVDLAASEAVLVTAVAIAAQVVAIAPGGFGTYEAAATAALVAVGVDAGTGLAIAVTAHAVKTVYALVAGAVGVAVPAPSLLGRLRLPRAGGPGGSSASDCDRPASGASTDPTAPVVVFLPAHDEEELVAGVVERVPGQVLGHPVECLVIDDGSTDDTAELAAAAGATVVSLPRNRGLGAAVRRGFAEATARGAAAAVFLDADGEYAPEELERMVAPILSDTADYVVGSRFAGDIGHMLPHRRFGNRALTMLVRWITRRDVTDGQSGYRALSPAAATHARIVHDFNYAQVLTIDLLRKGYRYHEVPISYHFRTAGRSFVRLGQYLRAVIPAIWHSLNDEVASAPATSGRTQFDHAGRSRRRAAAEAS